MSGRSQHEGFSRETRQIGDLAGMISWRGLGLCLCLALVPARADDNATPASAPAPATTTTTAKKPVQSPPTASSATSNPAAAPSGTPKAVASNPASATLPTTTVTTPSESDSIYKNMSLQQLMNQDVTSVSKEPEPYSEAAASIDVSTNEAIQRSGASSLPEALRLADNLDVAQDDAHDWNISARGFNAGLSNKLLVLDDGRTIYSPLFSGVIWDAQGELLKDVDRIEVVSGPGGTLWGANAVNGVINIVSKSAQDTQGWYVEGGGGDQLRDFGAARYGGTLAPNVYFRVWGTYFDQNGNVLSNGQPANDAWSQGRGGFRIDTDSKSDDVLTFQGEYYNGASGHEPEIGIDTQSGGNVLGRWTHTFSSDSEMSLQAYYDRTDYSEPVAGIGFQEIQPETVGRKIVFERQPLPTVLADAGLLRQVFSNLILNAIKYTRPRDPAKIEIGSKVENGEVIVHIKDNGVGFDPEYADKLFGVFQRLHSESEFEGTGVGLANVRRIITATAAGRGPRPGPMPGLLSTSRCRSGNETQATSQRKGCAGMPSLLERLPIGLLAQA